MDRFPDERLSPSLPDSPPDGYSTNHLPPRFRLVSQPDGQDPPSPSPEGFLRLPPEVIQRSVAISINRCHFMYFLETGAKLTSTRVLWTADSNSFASLCFINREWYKQAQSVELYAHHLSRCPSYALANTVITGPFRKNNLLRLKTKFAAEVRRNLFEAYLRPRQTLINLISINANSSAAFPGSEAFQFTFSPNGQTILALSSSRIYILDATSDTLVVQREFKTLRRSLSASITDDGSLLAVLSSKHQANIYGLTPDGVKHLQVLVLDNPPRTIALAHEGTVLAAAYEGGVEVFSLAANALSTDRRAVRSEAMDTLQFSGDGSMLVGSSQSLEEPNAVVITAPFYTENDPDMSSREIHSRMWTTQILFPQISSICSHAELLQGHTEGDATWLFAYDHSLMTFRAVRTDDTRTGVAYFLNPPVSRRFSVPAPSMAPAASACGTLVAAGFSMGGLWLYGVPERLDVSPDMGSVVERHEKQTRGPTSLTSATGHLEPLMAYSPSVSGSSEEIEDDSIASKVDWRQSLFVKCRGLESLEGFNAAKWVEQSEDRRCEFPGKRLVVVAPGGMSAFSEELGDESMPVDGSRVCLLDFDYGPSAQGNREITIEVGDNEPELLKEHTGDIDVEVAMERRRTVRTVRGRNTARSALSRSVTAASPHASGFFEQGMRMTSVSQPSSPSESLNQQILPSSRTPPTVALHRAATSGGIRGARFPPRPPLGSAQQQSSGQVHYGRRGGRRDSAESWESPPPPYSNPGSRGSPSRSQHAQLGSQQPATAWNSGPHAPGHHSGGYPPQGFLHPNQAAFAPYHIPGQPYNQYNTGVSPRSGNASGYMLPTVSEAGLPHPSSRSVSLPFPARAGNPEQYSMLSRPSTHEGFPPVEAPAFDLRPTITHPISPPTPDRDIHQQLPSPILQHSNLPPGSMTLTGANLANRLNHPVPPVPVSPEQQPANLQQNTKSAPRPAIANGFGHAPPKPSADQMSNLQRRVSLTRERPLSVVTNGAHPPGSPSPGGFGPVPPSPPRAAWGAAGVPGSPSFNKARQAPNGLSRNGSRGSNRSIPISYSTPNLHVAQRPIYGRLDTIDSIGSTHGDGPSRQRAGSVANSFSSPVREYLSADHNSGSMVDPMFQVKPKKKKGKKAKRDDERSQLGGEKKKGSRCSVM